jgi:hypothetical protein
MNSRPILFNAPMVCALLDGAKTQTRRVAKLTDAAHIKEVGGHRRWHPADPDVIAASPYGQVGDQLWVRETFCDATDGLHGRVLYRATGDTACKWKPSIFMPCAASRITLEITGVRVERLQDISEADALAEGIVCAGDGNGFQLADTTHYSNDPRESYASLWESLNGAGSWDLNPWVWVIEFKRIQQQN